MPYYNKDPERVPNIDNHPYVKARCSASTAECIALLSCVPFHVTRVSREWATGTVLVAGVPLSEKPLRHSSNPGTNKDMKASYFLRFGFCNRKTAVGRSKPEIHTLSTPAWSVEGTTAAGREARGQRLGERGCTDRSAHSSSGSL